MEVKVCKNCVMDTTDSKIVFDANGVCDYCNDFNNNIKPSWHPDEKSLQELKQIAAKIKEANKDKKYDCIVGFSGGVDSSYLLYVAKRIMGLRPLALIVDTGWNLNVADNNIKNILKNLNIDSKTVTIDFEEMKDLQIAFLKSSVPYQDLPQDHAIFATLYNYAIESGIKYVLTGANNATEALRAPLEWVYQNDLVMIKDIHKKFGKRELKNFPTCGLLKYRLYYPIFKGLKRVAPLNMVEYDINKVKKFLIEELGWEDYKEKHYEDVFTRWYEGYYLPKKFGYDKRKIYFSNLILTGYMTRDEALNKLKAETYSNEEIDHDENLIANKLGITVSELRSYIDLPNKTFMDYKNSYRLIQFGTKILRSLGIERKMFR